MTDPSTAHPASEAFVIPIALAPLLEPGEAVRPVPGASRYFVTDAGRLLSTVRTPRVAPVYVRESNGYVQAEVWYERGDGSTYRRTPSVHGLVAEAFLGPRPTVPGVRITIDHVDGDKTNNALSNLRYVPHGTNVRLAIDAGVHGTAKLSSSAVWALRCRAHVDDPETAVRAAMAEYGVTRATARDALARRSWKWVPDPAGRPDAATLADGLGVELPEAVRLLALSPFEPADAPDDARTPAVIARLDTLRPAA